MTPARRGARTLLAALAAGCLLATAAPATAAPAGPAEGDDAVAPAADLTITPDPSYAQPEFEGWGTSLVWFANATGDYPDEVREELYRLLFGQDGLRLNIARYNVGGGNAPDVPDYLRPGGAVEGWWQAPEGTTREDKDWWDPEDPAHWDLDADATQRWWVDRIKGDITHWEAFSNSPPWFMTESGYVSGGFDPVAEQVRPESIDDFATYLTRVTQELEAAHGITVDTVDPLNEPNTPYWSTRLGPDGNPVGGRQEGAHVGPARQAEIIDALAAELERAGSGEEVSAPDETNPGLFLADWYGYDQQTQDVVDQLNVHTYGTGQRTAARDVAKGEDKPLWMSEVEGNWGDRQDFESMVPGLGMADRIVDDLRELEPSAWVFWQPVEDYANMAPGGESALGMNWGSIQMPFDCTAEDTLETCPVYTNTKFDTVRNFTHFVRPGDHLVGVDDEDSVAAVSADGRSTTLVHVNGTDAARTVDLDLSGFATVHPGATARVVVTSADGALVEQPSVGVVGGTARFEAPAASVVTVVVDGVRGVAADAALVQPDHVYRLDGVQSDRSLAPAAEGAGLVLRTDAPTTAQLWRIGALTDEGSRTEHEVTNVATGERLAVAADGSLVRTAAAGEADAAARWVLSTTGDGTYTLVNLGTGRLVEVGGQARADGSPVGTWTPNSGDNQRWTVRDETVVGVDPVRVFTPRGVAPVLPTTVVPTTPSGPGAALAVQWRPTGVRSWTSARTVRVVGSTTDLLGEHHRVVAEVVVDDVADVTADVAVTTTAGTLPVLPATVPATTAGGLAVDLPVSWDQVAAGDVATPGTLEVAGTVVVAAGRTADVTAVVTVVPRIVNAAREAGTTATATYTEGGYSAARLVDGRLGEKAWSNWRSGTGNATDTVTITLPRDREVTGVVVHHYRDGADSYAQSLQVQVRAADGTWRDAGGPVPVPVQGQQAPVVTVPLDGTATRAVRVVLTAYPVGRWMTLSEIEVLAREG